MVSERVASALSSTERAENTITSKMRHSVMLQFGVIWSTGQRGRGSGGGRRKRSEKTGK